MQVARVEILCLVIVGLVSLFAFLSRLPGRGNLLWQLQQANLSDPLTIITGMLVILFTLPCALVFVLIFQSNGARPAKMSTLQLEEFGMKPRWRRFLDVYIWLITLGSVSPTALGEGVGAAAFGGMIAGAASHYFAGGKMTFPIFILANILILTLGKGKFKLVGIIVFTAVASLVVFLLSKT